MSGYHLVDDGFEALGRTVGYRPGRGTRWRRSLLRHPTPSYLGAIAVLASLHVVALAVALLAAGTAPAVVVVGVALALVPAATVAVSLVNRARDAGPPGARPAQDGLPRGPPGRLPDHGGRARPPRAGRRRVAAPVAARDSLARQRRRQPPSRAAGLPGRRPRGIDAGRRRSGAAARGRRSRAQREVRARRPRPVSPAASPAAVERRRGLLDGLGAQAREARRVQPPARRRSGDRASPVTSAIRDFLRTTPVRDHARRGHRAPPRRGPPPRRDPRAPAQPGRARGRDGSRDGRLHDPPAAHRGDALRRRAVSSFARLFAGDPGLDLYARAASDVYQDLFGEGIYVGKGIYEPVAFEESLRGRVPENARARATICSRASTAERRW